MLVLSIHPVFQFSAILLAWFAFSHGIQRFRSLHLHQKVAFKWKLHVTIGTIAFCMLLAGLIVGLVMVRTHWYRPLMTGLHAKVALTLIPFIFIGLSTGIYMNRNKKKRTLLPLIHAANNIFVLLLTLIQIATGINVYKSFVLGV